MTRTLRATLACSLMVTSCLAAWSCGGGSPPARQPVLVAPSPEPEPSEARASGGEPSDKDFESGEQLRLEGGPALGCEARAAGDWVRVRCVGLSYFGVPVWRISVDEASAGIHPKVSARLGDVSLKWRFSEGSALHASFVWFPNLVRLHAEWPNGSPRPRVVARFANVPSRRADELILAACECSPRLGPDLILQRNDFDCQSPSMTGDGIDAWEPECLRQLELGCQEFNECLTREPSGGRSCVEDEHQSGLGPFTSCHKKCDDTRRCPTGFSCEDAYEHNPMDEAPATRPFACFPTDEAQTEYMQALDSYLQSRAPLAN